MDGTPAGSGPATGARRRRDRVTARTRAAWDDWSRLDPLWAVVTDPARRDGRWDVDQFFASGEATVADLWERAGGFGLPAATGQALDYGCGVGRLTRALARRCDDVLGLDISAGMVEMARRQNAAVPNATFAVHAQADLSAYADGAFDVVCCLLVLQHIPSAPRAQAMVGELVRVLAPGGLLMLQLMTDIAPPPRPGIRARVRARTRLGGLLRRLGVPAALLRRTLGWQPDMALVAVPDDRAREIVAANGGRVVWSLPRREETTEDRLYLVTR